MTEKNNDTVPADVYKELLRKMDEQNRKLEAYEEKETLVGIRWGGEGSFGMGLTRTINGKSRIVLRGYGAKEVIDRTSWYSIRDYDLVKDGLIVRDDTVLEELGVRGVVAEDDRNVSPNAMTLVETIELLTGSTKKLKEKLSEITSHNAAIHLLREAKVQNITDIGRLSVIKDRRNYLFEKHNVNRMHDHDLRTSCDMHDIDTNLPRDQIVEMLTDINLQGNEY